MSYTFFENKALKKYLNKCYKIVFNLFSDYLYGLLKKSVDLPAF